MEMLTIQDVLDKIKDGSLTGDDLHENLAKSENKQGSKHVKAKGHALQHVAVLLDTPNGQFNYLKSNYHNRGKMKYHGETGEKVPVKGPQSHSQFKDQNEAVQLICMALKTRDGIKALRALLDDKNTAKLEVGFQKGLTAYNRTTHCIGDSPGDTRNFVLVDEMSISGIILELHNSCKVLNGLHFQSAYPTQNGPAPGQSILTIKEHTS